VRENVGVTDEDGEPVDDGTMNGVFVAVAVPVVVGEWKTGSAGFNLLPHPARNIKATKKAVISLIFRIFFLICHE
jgi:hypothetical protein